MVRSPLVDRGQRLRLHHPLPLNTDETAFVDLGIALSVAECQKDRQGTGNHALFIPSVAKCYKDRQGVWGHALVVVSLPDRRKYSQSRRGVCSVDLADDKGNLVVANRHKDGQGAASPSVVSCGTTQIFSGSSAFPFSLWRRPVCASEEAHQFLNVPVDGDNNRAGHQYQSDQRSVFPCQALFARLAVRFSRVCPL